MRAGPKATAAKASPPISPAWICAGCSKLVAPHADRADRAGRHALRRQSRRRFAAGQQSGGLPICARPRFGGADLRGVNLSGAKLNHADLRDAKLGPLLISGDRLLPARLDNAEARYADFRGADLRRVRLTGSDLAYANLTDADLRDADMTDVDLTGAKLPMQFAAAASA